MSGREGRSAPEGRRGAARWAALGLGVGLGAGCVQLGMFPCEQDSQCVLDGREGVCADAGFCALPDERCDSGYRFHARGVPDDLAGQCMPPLATEGSSTGSGEGSSEDTGTTTIDGSSGPASSSSDGGSSTTTGSECGDHPCPCSTQLAVGTNHTCVTRTDGDVTCWGANNQAQLGDGTVTPSAPGYTTFAIPGEAPLDAIVSGGEHLCVLTMGQLSCWGRNTNNQIVPGGADQLPPQTMPVSEPPGAIGLGLEHSCVAEPGGPAVQCLGGNINDELGGGGALPVSSALPVMQAIDALAIGDDHSCALANGRVWCWGSDAYGQLGQNTVAGPTPMKTEVSLPSDAVMLVAGADHTCAVIASGTVVRCWGRNNNGQIGDGTTTNRQLPTALEVQPPSGVVAIDSVVDTTCALLTDGALWCWGGNQTADLGLDIDPGDPLTVPQAVPGVALLPEPIESFGVGARHLCVRASSGRVWCWGRNNVWQVGDILELLVAEPFEVDLGCPPP